LNNKILFGEKMHQNSIEKEKRLTCNSEEQTKGCFLLIGAVQNTYLTRRLNGICWINSAENLKSSILQTKYCPSTCEKSTKISWREKDI
jgi:hypothetical protein